MAREITPQAAVQIVQADAAKTVSDMNNFTKATFRTRGGRLGSGMGSLLEALWVYYMNRALQNEGGIARECELAWLPDHQPADFACLHRGFDWKPESRAGELFRIEAKSMNVGVEEAKGHFTNLEKETSDVDQLLILIWSWTEIDKQYVWPRVHDYFLAPSKPIIKFRDALHVARGGSFVNPQNCPDGCKKDHCTHAGEPVNAANKRERRTGPLACKPANVDYAANFGGLLRMIKTDSENARLIFRGFRKRDDVVNRYISFIHEHYPNEERNQYKRADWQAAARSLGLQVSENQNDLIAEVRKRANYRDVLRALS